MSMNGLHAQRAKFEDFKLKLWNARNNVQEMQWKADAARKVPDTASMTSAELNAAIEAHEAGEVNAKREAQEASEKHAGVCREFRDWCSLKRDEIPRILDNRAQVFEDTEREEWQKLRMEIAEHLPSLEAECPRADDPPPPRPLGTARRTM
jgi:hypothetical protein